MANLYAACDLYVLPSLVDNLPNMLIESIACGTPCLSFNVGGCPDIVRDGVTGYLVHERTATALAATASSLIQQSPADRLPLRTSCRTVAEAEYSDAGMAEKHIELYRDNFR